MVGVPVIVAGGGVDGETGGQAGGRPGEGLAGVGIGGGDRHRGDGGVPGRGQRARVRHRGRLVPGGPRPAVATTRPERLAEPPAGGDGDGAIGDGHGERPEDLPRPGRPADHVGGDGGAVDDDAERLGVVVLPHVER